MFTPEEYEKKRKKLKDERGYCEIYIPRLNMQEYNVKFNGLYGAYSMNGKLSFQEEQFVNCVDRYQRDANREAVFENGERIKYKENIRFEEKEWIFAPGLGWENIPEEAIEEIKSCNCMWNYYGKVVDDENYADPKSGWRDEFFIMKSSGEWKFRISPNVLVHDEYWKPISLRKPRKKFSLFGE
jgi:hypothetical protein